MTIFIFNSQVSTNLNIRKKGLDFDHINGLNMHKIFFIWKCYVRPFFIGNLILTTLEQKAFKFLKNSLFSQYSGIIFKKKVKRERNCVCCYFLFELMRYYFGNHFSLLLLPEALMIKLDEVSCASSQSY